MTQPRRARPMSPEDRREQILDTAIPLILERGAEVTTRELADAAGIAEGTIFRVFSDKSELIDAAIARVMDSSATLRVLEQVDPHLPLEDKVEYIVAVLSSQVRGVVQFMTALGPREHARHKPGPDHPHRRPPLGEATGVVARLLEPDAHRLRVPVATAVDYLRILVFGTTMPFLTTGTASDPSELADFILRGIAAEGD